MLSYICGIKKDIMTESYFYRSRYIFGRKGQTDRHQWTSGVWIQGYFLSLFSDYGSSYPCRKPYRHLGRTYRKNDSVI